MNFNPLKMGTVEKRLLMGGLVTSFSYYTDLAAEKFVPEFPPQLSERLNPNLPKNGEIIFDLAPTVLLYVAKKVSKNSKTKEKLGDLALGSALYSVPNIIVETGAMIARNLGTPPVLATRIAAPTKYKVSAVAPTRMVAPTVGKYRVTA